MCVYVCLCLYVCLGAWNPLLKKRGCPPQVQNGRPFYNTKTNISPQRDARKRKRRRKIHEQRRRRGRKNKRGKFTYSGVADRRLIILRTRFVPASCIGTHRGDCWRCNTVSLPSLPHLSGGVSLSQQVKEIVMMISLSEVRSP